MGSSLSFSRLMPSVMMLVSATCSRRSPEDCEAGVSYITGLMRDEGEVAAAVAFLQGDAYCAQAEDPANCGELIAALIPAAMDVLAAAFEETSVEICQDVNGVC